MGGLYQRDKSPSTEKKVIKRKVKSQFQFILQLDEGLGSVCE